MAFINKSATPQSFSRRTATIIANLQSNLRASKDSPEQNLAAGEYTDTAVETP